MKQASSSELRGRVQPAWHVGGDGLRVTAGTTSASRGASCGVPDYKRGIASGSRRHRCGPHGPPALPVDLAGSLGHLRPLWACYSTVTVPLRSRCCQPTLQRFVAEQQCAKSTPYADGATSTAETTPHGPTRRGLGRLACAPARNGSRPSEVTGRLATNAWQQTPGLSPLRHRPRPCPIHLRRAPRARASFRPRRRRTS
jgi:hypothetical protein